LRRSAWTEVDVVVLGGGPAGAATALALIQRGFSVAVIEKSAYDAVRVGETLPPRIRPLLVTLGVWEQFLSDGHLPAAGIRSAWGRDDLRRNDFLFNPYGEGWHVDRRRFDSMLAGRAGNAGAILHCNTSLASCSRDRRWQLEISSAERRGSLSARLIVDATGRNSSFANQRGVRRISYDHSVGIAAFGKRAPGAEADCFTFIESAEDGWWYGAVLPGHSTAVVYMTDADLYAQAEKRERNCWQRKVRRTLHVRSLVRSHVMETRRHVVAAGSSRLETMAGPDWLAVGDAAMTFDPLSGHGVYKAIECAIRAAGVIEQSLAGVPSALRDYDAAMKRDFDEYRRIQRRHYRSEPRWPDSVFWQRRQRF
jgi:flavin-dependent dehydrogenase